VPHPSTAPGLRYAPGLDGVRALAVLAVVVYHIGTTSYDLQPLRGGYLGVDLFFVLSGYLITSLLVVEARQSGRISIRKFYERRARRLLPALYTLLLAIGAIGAIWLPQQAAKLRGDLISALSYVTNWWLISERSSYFGNGDRPRLLTHLWSLAVEEQFYVIWPLVLILVVRMRARRASLLSALVLAILVSTLLGLALYDPWLDPSRVYYGTDTRALAPLIGAALAVWVQPWQHRTDLRSAARWGLDTLGLLALAGLGVIAFQLPDTDPMLYRGGLTVIALLGAALIAAAGHPATLLGRVLGTQPLRWLGERSYAVYLWHWPICVLTRPGVDIALTGWANAALRVGLALVLAEISYRLVERPMRRPGFFLGQPVRAGGDPAGAAGGRQPVPVGGRPLAPADGRFRHAQRVGLQRPVLRSVAIATVTVLAATAVGFQLSAAAARPVQTVPVDAGPAQNLGPIAAATPTASGRPTPGPQPIQWPPGPQQLVIFGDSQGMTLLINRPADLGSYFNATDATIEGCGVLVGRVASRSGERRDLSPTCDGWTARWEASANRLHPHVALVMIGAWEVFDLTTAAGTLTFGSPQWDANLTAALRQGIGVLRKSGATVALALLPCYRPVRASAGYWPERGDDQRTRHINDVLLDVAVAEPSGVYVVQPPGEFCTDPTISTSLSYRWDGVHYYKPGAALYFHAALPQLLALVA